MATTEAAVPEPEAPSQDTFHLTLYFNSGCVVDTLITDAIGTEPEDVAGKLFDALRSQERPGWIQVGNLVAFSGAVGAFEIDTA